MGSQSVVHDAEESHHSLLHVTSLQSLQQVNMSKDMNVLGENPAAISHSGNANEESKHMLGEDPAAPFSSGHGYGMHSKGECIEKLAEHAMQLLSALSSKHYSSLLLAISVNCQRIDAGLRKKMVALNKAASYVRHFTPGLEAQIQSGLNGSS